MRKKPTNKAAAAPKTNATKPLQTWIRASFGLGVYKFFLDLPQAIELERFAGKGFFAIVGEVLAGRVAVENPSSPLRLGEYASTIGNPFNGELGFALLRQILIQGLIGGGEGIVDGEKVKVTPKMALDLVNTYGPPVRPLEETWEIAAELMYAAMCGIEPYPDEEASDG